MWWLTGSKIREIPDKWLQGVENLGMGGGGYTTPDDKQNKRDSRE